MSRVSTTLRRAGAVAVGLALGATWFVRYGAGGAHGDAHQDHTAHHGGIVGMVGDVHMEIVRADDALSVYLSDAYRRPLRARGGTAAFEHGPTISLTWNGASLSAPDVPQSVFVTCTAHLANGTTVEMSVALEPAESS